jgi:hypothetical protein
MSQHSPRLTPASLYLLIALPATVILSFFFINLHAPDDSDHLKRAYTLLHRPLSPVTPPGRATGAMVDSGLDDYISAQRVVSLVPAKPLSATEAAGYRTAPEARWTGKQRFSELPGAMSYFPALYAPQALALDLGRLAGASVQTSVYLARFANGLAAIALVALGLRLLPFGHSLVLLVLLLPRTLLQFASNSADPILYGLALIVTAIGLQRAGRLNSVAGDGLAAACLFVAASVRPPIAGLAFQPGIRALRERRWLSLLILVGALAAAASWTLIIMAHMVDTRCGGGTSPLGARLAAFATGWPSLIGHSLADKGAYYFLSFIGHFGWGDGPGGSLQHPLPLWMYASATALIILAIRNDVRTRATLDLTARLSLAAGAATVILVTFLAMYVACVAPSASTIAGVQGRYFVPALIAIAPALSGLRPGPRDRLQALFPLVLAVWAAACVLGMSLHAHMLYQS